MNQNTKMVKRRSYVHSKSYFTPEKIIELYNILCAIATVCIVLRWIYQYSLQNLSSSIDIKNFFESEKDVQPAFSVCVIDPELDMKLRRFGYNESIYMKFLQGKVINENLRKLDFKNVRFNWSDYFYKQPYASLVSDDGENLGNSRMSEKWHYYTSFIGLQSNNKYLTDCIALEPLSRDVSSIKMLFNLSIFDQGIRRQYQFRVFLHYPGQLLRSYSTLKHKWDLTNDTTTYIMTFRISYVQVLERILRHR